MNPGKDTELLNFVPSDRSHIPVVASAGFEGFNLLAGRRIYTLEARHANAGL
jgi:hypothetical protein